METQFYLPILKSKTAEFLALSTLPSQVKKKIIPLFEVTPIEWDQAERKKPLTLARHLDSFCNKMEKKWSSDNCFIDTHLLNWDGSDNRSQIRYVFDVLASKEIIPIPVVWANSPDDFLSIIKQLIDHYAIGEVCLRVTPNEATDPDFEKEVSKILAHLGLGASNCHLLLDLKDSNYSDVENFADGIVALLESFPFFIQWQSFTLAGTAFPSSSTIKEGVWEFDRNDWKVFNAVRQMLSESDQDRELNFGDYSIVNPEYFEFKPKVMKSSANIRYTHDEIWIIAKGKALKKSADYAQYKGLAQSIVKTSYFLGKDFSDGDSYLYGCSKGTESTGNPSVWLRVGNNHHFMKVVMDLFATSAVS